MCVENGFYGKYGLCGKRGKCGKRPYLWDNNHTNHNNHTYHNNHILRFSHTYHYLDPFFRSLSFGFSRVHRNTIYWYILYYIRLINDIPPNKPHHLAIILVTKVTKGA